MPSPRKERGGPGRAANRGRRVNPASPSQLETTIGPFTVPGRYLYRLTASDGQLSASDDVMVTVCNGDAGPVDVVLVMDNSGSMGTGNQEDPTGLLRFVRARTGAKTFLDFINPADDQVGDADPLRIDQWDDTRHLAGACSDSYQVNLIEHHRLDGEGNVTHGDPHDGTAPTPAKHPDAPLECVRYTRAFESNVCAEAVREPPDRLRRIDRRCIHGLVAELSRLSQTRPPPHDDEMLRGESHLAHQVTGHQDGAALGG